MNPTRSAALFLCIALCAPALAQPAEDPVVRMRAEKRALRADYAARLVELDKTYDARFRAAVAEALRDPALQDKDPLVAKREAEARVKRRMKPEYDAQVRALHDEYRARAAAERVDPAVEALVVRGRDDLLGVLHDGPFHGWNARHRSGRFRRERKQRA